MKKTAKMLVVSGKKTCKNSKSNEKNDVCNTLVNR